MFKGIITIVVCALLLSPAFSKGPENLGPEDGDWAYGECFRLQSSLDEVTWTEIDSALHPFGYVGCAVIGNYMYAFGGGTGNFGQALNLTTWEWEQSIPPPLGMNRWCCVAAGESLYLIGRYEPPYYGAEIQKFTPVGGGPSGTWTQVAPQPIASCGKGASWDGGNYIYAGGGNPEPARHSLHRYSISADEWVQLADIPIEMAYCGGAYVGGEFYLMGGISSPASISLYEYDPATNSWTQKANMPTTVWCGAFSVTSNDAYLFSVGGNLYYPPTDAVQVYDPTTDVWVLETPLPALVTVNAACYVGNGTIISTGGYAPPPPYYLKTTYRSVGFPVGAVPPPPVTLTMNPTGSTTIPAIGGSFDYEVTLHNETTAPVTLDAWIMVQLPNGSWYGPVLGPLTLTIPGGASVTRQRTQYVPGSAPAGDYLYEGRVGEYPDSIWDSDNFAFEKLAAGDSGTPVSDWENYGQSFDSWMTSLPDVEIPAEFTLHGAYPNPFNPITTLSFSLPQAGWVRVEVFDVTGQAVNVSGSGTTPTTYGPGTHQITFNASNLPSGIYFARLTAGDMSQVWKLVLMK